MAKAVIGHDRVLECPNNIKAEILVISVILSLTIGPDIISQDVLSKTEHKGSYTGMQKGGQKLRSLKQ